MTKGLVTSDGNDRLRKENRRRRVAYASPVLSDTSPQKFHKMNCKVSLQRFGLVSGCFTAKVSQNELQSFAAKVQSVSGCFAAKVSQNELQSFAARVRSCQWMLRRKSFTK